MNNADWTACSDPPEESCSDAGCPVHNGDRYEEDDAATSWWAYSDDAGEGDE